MTYKFRVTLEGLKGFLRVYAVNAGNTLYTFHKQLRSDLEFPQDQQILFKAFDAAGNVVARYALIDLGFKAVDEVSIDEVVKAGIVKFQYFYDVVSKKSVIITFDGECDKQYALPTILETKGPLPIEFENGYVAYEDLPEEEKHHHHKDKHASNPLAKMFGIEDDEDFDEDDEDEEDEPDPDKEEEEIIYDENE